MAILKIARMGHPVLRAPASPVDDPTAPDIKRLAADMVDTMLDAPGIGLAAPQVHVPLRVVVFRIPAGRNGEEEGVPLTVLVNPAIEILADTVEEGVEACLSIPGMAGIVPRPTHVRYRATDPEGTAIERDAEGYHARVVQHECDHLDGILYPMRMPDLSTLGFVDELTRQIDDEESGAPREQTAEL